MTSQIPTLLSRLFNVTPQNTPAQGRRAECWIEHGPLLPYRHAGLKTYPECQILRLLPRHTRASLSPANDSRSATTLRRLAPLADQIYLTASIPGRLRFT